MNRNLLSKLQTMGIVLVGASYLASYNNVLANDVTDSSINTSSNYYKNADSEANTSNSTLNQVVLEAKQEGLTVVETEAINYTNYSDLQDDYLNQIQTIKLETTLYQESKQSYNKQLEAYQLNQKEQEQYQKDVVAYNHYLKEQDSYNKDYSAYQKDYQAYEAILLSNKKLETDYQKDLAVYNEQLLAYNKDEITYQNGLIANAKAKEDYGKQLAQYNKDLQAFEEAKQLYDEAKKREARLKAQYDKDLAVYKQQLKEYELEKAVYDEKLAKAKADTRKDGFLSQVHAQYLIFKSELNAKVTFENVSDFFSPNHQFGGGLSGIGGNIADIELATRPHLFEGVGAGTAAGDGDGYGLILEKGKPITVIYTGLEKSSYNGRAITKVVYTYELTSTFAPDGRATAFIYTDPTETIYVGTSGNNQGTTDFNIHQTITYYYTDDEKVTLAPNTTALLSFASRNNTFEFGEQEYVKMGRNMTFIPITGSSVSGEDGYIASRGSNNSQADGSRLNRGDWDVDGHPNEYYGAGVVQVTGNAISFDFGIRYSQADITKSAKPTQLRNGSRQWFTVNSDLKASGILQETLREKPEAPKVPSLDSNLLIEPIKPIKPKEPIYHVLRQPVKPIPPKQPIIVVPTKPTQPLAPKVIAKPIKPEEVLKPSGVLTPILFYHKNNYKPIPVILPNDKVSKETRPISVPSVIYTVTSPREITNSPTLVSNLVYGTNNNNYAISNTNVLKEKTNSPKSPPTVPMKPKAKGKGKKPTSKKDKLIDNFKINLDIGKSEEGNLTEKEAKASSKATLDYIDYLAKKLTKKHKGDKAKVNRDLALMLAYKDYSGDKLQQMLNYFVEPYKHKNKEQAIETLSDNHTNEKSKIDFAHTMTTLASLENQSGHKHEMMKGLFSMSNPAYYLPVAVINPTAGASIFGFEVLAYPVMGFYNRDTILQLNSFVGDAYTTNSKKDIYSDMDAIILSKHPAYKDLPVDERIKKYYGQSNLNTKREELFLAVYDKNKSIAQKKAALDMLEATLTIGGLGALMYAKYRRGKTNKEISDNIVLTDKVAFGGTLDYWQKNPLNALRDITGIYSEPIVKSAKKALSIAGKTIQTGIDKAKNLWNTTTKTIGEVTTATVDFVKKGLTPKPSSKMNNKGNNLSTPSRTTIHSKPKLSKVVSVVTQPPIVKHVVKPLVKVIKPVVKPLIKPIVKAVAPIVNRVKQIFRPVLPQKPKVNPPKKGKRRR